MPRLRLALGQLDTVVGDLAGNVDRMLAALAEAESSGADLCVFPELAITGYPPEDLLHRADFLGENMEGVARVAAAVGECAAVVGFVDAAADGRLFNAVAVCARGSVLAVVHKELLPNYGVFDERRWFTPGDGAPCLFEVAGVAVGAVICEDVWHRDGPAARLARAGAQLVVVCNASPYSVGHGSERLGVLRARVAETGCALAYVNQVGGQDELVFDGASLVLDASGGLSAAAAQFVPELLCSDVQVPARKVPVAVPVLGISGAPRDAVPLAPSAVPDPLPHDAEVYEALVLGTRDYLAKNGFTDVVMGLSGGVDSSLVAVLAVDAIGPEHVHGMSLPSRYSSEGSRADAALLCETLGIDLSTVPIEQAHEVLAGLLAPVLGGEPVGLADENLQSRIRGVLLMAVSNAKGWMVLTTGNKSEMATGYSTLYGDSAGGFAVIKDVPKTLVYELCRYRNRRAGRNLIPESVLEKPPSAELRADQRDDESLPPYDILDPVLAGYVEEDLSAGDLVAAGYPPDVVARVADLVDRAEYKRRQAPPGVRISAKAFGKDRRMPISNHFRGAPVAWGGPGPVGAEQGEVTRA